jgi:hypothetical protein
MSEVEMAKKQSMYTAPVFLGTAFLVFGLAIFEKALNVFGLSIPFTDVYPRQLLDWTVALLIFDIALTLRQMFENRLT